MGNCQAAEAATVVIQHPGSNKVERIYWSVSAQEVMNSNPGHYVALLVSSPTIRLENGTPVKQFKLPRPDDTLHIGQVYRLISFKGGKKYGDVPIPTKQLIKTTKPMSAQPSQVEKRKRDAKVEASQKKARCKTSKFRVVKEGFAIGSESSGNNFIPKKLSSFWKFLSLTFFYL
ncbi:hypothetical protein UlMin_014919 [Ulmus minor]